MPGRRWALSGRALLWGETPAVSGGGELGRGKEGSSVTHPSVQPQGCGGGEGEWLFTATHPPPAMNRPPA